MAADDVRVFHASDLHFGRPAVPAQIEAIEAVIQDEKFDVVAISGDLSQRARSGTGAARVWRGCRLSGMLVMADPS